MATAGIQHDVPIQLFRPDLQRGGPQELHGERSEQGEPTPHTTVECFFHVWGIQNVRCKYSWNAASQDNAQTNQHLMTRSRGWFRKKSVNPYLHLETTPVYPPEGAQRARASVYHERFAVALLPSVRG